MKSSFPNSSQFSPTQINLAELLLIVKEKQPDREKIKDAIQKRFFQKSNDDEIANNTIFALSEYKIINKPKDNIFFAELTPLGESLAKKAELGKADEPMLMEMYEELARHILVNLHGLELLQCVDDLVQRKSKISKQTISQELSFRGFHIPTNGTHLNGMRQWLEMAGLFEKGKWVPDRIVQKKLLGEIETETLDRYAELSREQRAFAIAFARLNVEQALSNKVAKYATALFGVNFPEGGLPQSTLFPLRDVGLITCEKTTKGQGAKPYIVRPTEQLKNDFLEPILMAIENSIGLGIKYRKLIRMPFEEILRGLDDDSKHKKGLALEALVFYFGRLIDLNFVQWRLRSSETGGAELDVIMEGVNLIFSRWQIQCKNSSKATLEDIAKEVGIAQVIRTNVIMIVTTGTIGSKARDFAERIMQDTNYQIILLEKTHLAQIKENPAAIIEILHAQSERAMTLKRNQLGSI